LKLKTGELDPAFIEHFKITTNAETGLSSFPKWTEHGYHGLSSASHDECLLHFTAASVFKLFSPGTIEYEVAVNRVKTLVGDAKSLVERQDIEGDQLATIWIIHGRGTGKEELSALLLRIFPAMKSALTENSYLDLLSKFNKEQIGSSVLLLHLIARIISEKRLDESQLNLSSSPTLTNQLLKLILKLPWLNKLR
jgi:hypothetical protein